MKEVKKVLNSNTGKQVNPNTKKVQKLLDNGWILDVKKGTLNPPTSNINGKIYYTHDNGERPFKVIINNKQVLIFINKTMTDINVSNDVYSDQPNFTYNVEKIFIGRSPKNKMTLFSAGFGSKFTGNSILLSFGNNNYIFIGDTIYSFTV